MENMPMILIERGTIINDEFVERGDGRFVYYKDADKEIAKEILDFEDSDLPDYKEFAIVITQHFLTQEEIDALPEQD